MFFLGFLSIQCKIKRERPTETRWSTCWSPLLYSTANFTPVKVNELRTNCRCLFRSAILLLCQRCSNSTQTIGRVGFLVFATCRVQHALQICLWANPFFYFQGRQQVSQWRIQHLGVHMRRWGGSRHRRRRLDRLLWRAQKSDPARPAHGEDRPKKGGEDRHVGHGRKRRTRKGLSLWRLHCYLFFPGTFWVTTRYASVLQYVYPTWLHLFGWILQRLTLSQESQWSNLKVDQIMLVAMLWHQQNIRLTLVSRIRPCPYFCAC